MRRGAKDKGESRKPPVETATARDAHGSDDERDPPERPTFRPATLLRRTITIGTTVIEFQGLRPRRRTWADTITPFALSR